MSSCGDSTMLRDVANQGETNNHCQTNDIIAFCLQHRLDHVAEKIFLALDLKSLFHAEEVSALWKNVIIRRTIWKKIVLETLNGSRLFTQVLNYRKWGKLLIQSEESALSVHTTCKQLLIRTFLEIRNLKKNWKESRYILSTKSTEWGKKYLQFNHEKIITGTRRGNISIYRIRPLSMIKMFYYTLNNIRGKIYCLLLHGNKVVTASTDGLLFIWDSVTENVTATLKFHNTPVRVIRVFADIFMTCSEDGRIVFWKIGSLSVKHMTFFEGIGEKLVDADYNYKYAAAVYGYKQIRVWMFSTIKDGNAIGIRPVYGFRDFHGSLIITCLKINGCTLVTGSLEGMISVLNIQSGTCYLNIMGHRAPIISLKLVQENVVSASLDGLIKVWGWNGRFLDLMQDPLQYSTPPRIVCMQADNFYVVYATEDNKLNVRNYFDCPEQIDNCTAMNS